MKECIGTYEFGVVPRSLFASDGTVLLAYDKAKILHHLELLVSNEQLVTHTPAMETSTSVASNNEKTSSQPGDTQPGRGRHLTPVARTFN